MSFKLMNGRRVLYTDAEVIDDNNINLVLQNAMNTHILNRGEIDYLWNYYKGKQPIQNRVKSFRPEICNNIVENRANEIVSFKVGYLCGEPIQYIGRTGDEVISRGISKLNEMMLAENKPSQDIDLVTWLMIAGTSYRMVLPDYPKDIDDAPFELYTLDPRDTFIVYSNEIGNKPMLGVKYFTDENGNVTVSAYSENHFWKIKDGNIISSKPHALTMIPIFEYPANTARLGAFEIVLDLLDAINDTVSNRIDAIEQFVQSFIKFKDCDISEDDFEALKRLGAIKIKSTEGKDADVDIISSELNQTQTQVSKDDLYDAVLTICGVPSRNGGSSISDTGAAVLLRDGWSLAEARAKESELVFKRAEQNMLNLVLRICKDSPNVPSEVNALRLKDISLQFTRRNYENVQSKSQVLVSMLQQDKIHPRLAFTSCGLFSDPEQAYAESMAYYEEQKKETVNET